MRRAAAVLLACATGATGGLGAQVNPAPPPPAGVPSRVTVVPGARYAAGWLHELLLGSHYRDLWATPLEVEVLDLSRFAGGGGLTPTRCGGRRQTKSLRFLGADGREYVFRSVDKDPTLALPPELRQTFARQMIQDQISSAHPAAPVVVAPLLEAAGVLHAEPRLVVLPADPRLAGFDCVYGGMLGTIEERPTEPPDNEVAFAGAAALAGTKELFEILERDSDHRIDSRAFLAARLLDVYIGDWDRHQDQWRFARFDEGGLHRWQPIPRDRDQAFARLDGFLIWLAGFYHPQLIGFGDDYPSLYRLTFAGQVVDRRLLTALERPVWDSVAAAVQARLTDSVIAAAVRRLPAEFYRRNGADLARALRRRRDRLPDAAARFYRLLAREVDVQATDRSDVAEVRRLERGRVEVRLAAAGAPGPYYRRTFDPRDTREIRLYLHGGEDRVIVRGGRGAGGGGPTVRVIGGGGNDALVDSSRAGAGPTRFYDDRGDNRFVRGPNTKVDRARYDPPPIDTVTLGRPRDWGTRSLPFTWVSFGPDIGLFAGGGVVHTRYGFRHVPYRSRYLLRAGYATGAQTYRALVTAELRGLLPPAIVGLRLRASGLEIIRFYGLGNETAATGSNDFHKVRQDQVEVAPSLALSLSPAARLSLGPVYKFARTDLEPGSFIDATRPYGVGSFDQVGVQAGFRVDTRDQPAAASRGVLLELGGSFYPAALDVVRTFGWVEAAASGYVTAPIPTNPTFALRIGGKKVWGTYPFHEAAYVGGGATVRGFSEQRFAGDAALFGNAEVRLFLANFYAFVPGEIGLVGLADAGRVFLDGQASDRWHPGVGGGLWFSFLSRANTLTLAVARSVERTGVYIGAGFNF